MSDRDRVKGALAALRAAGIPARHSWVGMDFDGVQVDLAGLPVRDWYDPDGNLFTALPLAMPLGLSSTVVVAVLRAGFDAVSCPFYDLGVVWVCPTADDADRVRSRWEAEVAADPDALRGLSVEDSYRLGRLAVAS